MLRPIKWALILLAVIWVISVLQASDHPSVVVVEDPYTLTQPDVVR